MKKRILSFVTALFMVCGMIVYMPFTDISAKAANTADSLVAIAEGELGSTNYRKYYGGNAGAWCADFVTWCAQQAGVSSIYNSSSCYSMYTGMKNNGCKEVSSPQKGDIVFYYCNSCSGTQNIWCHVGIMINSSTSIDGNYGGKVSYDNAYNHYGNSGYKHGDSTGSISRIYVRPNYIPPIPPTPILPGEKDNSYAVPTNITATHKISTYDQYGNVESNHCIYSGDNCYISEVYTNGFVRVNYPVSGGDRWAYAKKDDFNINKLNENVNLHVWVSDSKMGDVPSSFKTGNYVYLCYELTYPDSSQKIGNYNGNYYKATETFKDSNNKKIFDASYDNSDSNWISIEPDKSGHYSGVVNVTGAINISASVEFDVLNSTVNLHTWISDITLCKVPSQVKTGDSVYLCYELKDPSTGNTIGNYDSNYKVNVKVTDTSGKILFDHTFDNCEKKNIKVTANKSGKYKCTVTATGSINISCNVVLNVIDSQENCSHTYGEWFVTKPATESQSGSEYRICSLCEKKETKTISQLTNVNYKWGDANGDGNVTQDDLNTINAYKNAKNSTNKSYPEKIIIKNSDVNKDGTLDLTDMFKINKYILMCSKGNHNWSEEWTVDKEPTATEPGSKSHHCTVCDEKTDITEIPATENTSTNDDNNSIEEIHSDNNNNSVVQNDSDNDNNSIEEIYSDNNNNSVVQNDSEIVNSIPIDDYTEDISSNDNNDQYNYNDTYENEVASSRFDDETDDTDIIIPDSTIYPVISKISAKTATGRQIKPKVKVVVNGKTLKNGTDYTVKYGTNKVGKGTVKIIGKGKYAGKFNVTKTFVINPRKTSVSLKTTKGKITVSLKRISEAKKYQIQYSTNSKFKGAKTVSITAVKKSISAKSKKTYYVRARSVNGKYLSGWSAVKKVKVK